MARILLLHRYSRKAASFRHRLLQFVPYLEKDGIHCSISSLYTEEMVGQRIRMEKAGALKILAAAVRRTLTVLFAFRYDLVILYDEVLPFLPAFFERYLRLIRVPYIYDYDDAVFHKYDQSRNPLVRLLLGRKILAVCKSASCVFPGNRYLEDYARQANPRTVVVPTVIDLDRYAKTKKFEAKPKTLTIGWIGSPSTAEHLGLVAEPLRQLSRTVPLKLVVIGSGPLELPGVPMEVRDWSEDTEVDEILGFDVGIMPLIDTPWSRGKCGFKLIQYMACGLPVIASPVGVNREIVEPGVNGYLATTAEEWMRAVHALWDAPESLARFGAAGRRKAEQKYSLQAIAPKFVEWARKIAGESHRRAV